MVFTWLVGWCYQTQLLEDRGLENGPARTKTQTIGLRCKK